MCQILILSRHNTYGSRKCKNANEERECNRCTVQAENADQQTHTENGESSADIADDEVTGENLATTKWRRNLIHEQQATHVRDTLSNAENKCADEEDQEWLLQEG